MIVRAIDVEDDWRFGKGKSDYLKDNQAIAQNITTRLKSFLGDCFFSLDSGIDWFNLLGTNEVLGLTLSIKTTILNTPGVTGIVDLSSDLDENRNQTLRYSVTTVFSTQEPLTGTVRVI